MRIHRTKSFVPIVYLSGEPRRCYRLPPVTAKGSSPHSAGIHVSTRRRTARATRRVRRLAPLSLLIVTPPSLPPDGGDSRHQKQQTKDALPRRTRSSRSPAPSAYSIGGHSFSRPEDPFAFLSRFDTVVLIDDSGSMTDSRGSGGDPSGAGRAGTGYNVRDAEQVGSLFKRRVRAAGGDAWTTDVKPSALLAATRKLDAIDAPPYQVGGQFFQVRRHRYVERCRATARTSADESSSSRFLSARRRRWANRRDDIHSVAFRPGVKVSVSQDAVTVIEPVRCWAVRAPLCPAYGRRCAAWSGGRCEPKCPSVVALYLGRLSRRDGPPPCQRVVPKTSRTVYITFGKRSSFNLAWNPNATEDDVPLAQQNLIRHARLLAVTGVAFPDPDEASTTPQSPALASRST
ncbi:hypothetical protein GGTG_08527 [Gaeumannomyces tritici R3-111a-1]|uniref:VWFA domain-containing protein n=1 Tax=Gaeumannomyces tritici (strain R3-111a-1) TaxID=644352 RepID=J3P4U1_GAET3|nr:hypothetical protein GGTG_08527 [Gaeumannomyces tritici R3-111a-1]EJT74689.1 hypothetical protein GGTG_08527 [Gaeumannomyces tritici R3-111a-1]